MVLNVCMISIHAIPTTKIPKWWYFISAFYHMKLDDATYVSFNDSIFMSLN